MALKVLCIGAHPDDCEGSVGGTALRFRQRGDRVTFVSVTDGSRGHFSPEYLANPDRLVARRRQEMLDAATPFGIDYRWMDVRDGEVIVDLPSTEAMIRLIREEAPDLVLMNRPCDYHRDHRYAAQLVLDASYMLTVPFVCPDTPILRVMPVFAYWQDGFTESGAFRADVVVPIDDVIDDKVEMMLAHASQYLEWLPYNAAPGSRLYDLPTEPDLRREAARESLRESSRHQASRYGGDGGYAEAFQISEYGFVPDAETLSSLFPV